MSRERIKYVQGKLIPVTTHTLEWSGAISIANKNVWGQTYTSDYEKVSDVVNSTRKGQWNSFEHYKRSCRPTTLTNDWWCNLRWPNKECFVRSAPVSAYAFIPIPWGPADQPTGGLDPLIVPEYNIGGSTYFTPTLTNEVSVNARALRAMLPLIKPNLQSIPSLYELKDFASLGETTKRVVRLGELLNQIKHWRRHSLKVGLSRLKRLTRAVAGTSADVYLQAEFNVMPLLSDIIGVHTSLTRTRDKISEILKNEGKFRRRHIGFDLASEFSPSTEDGSSTSYLKDIASTCRGGNWIQRRSVSYGKRRYHAEVEYVYELEAYQREHAALLGLLDALGIGRNGLKDLWQVLPWSFAIDFVVNVSSFLDRFDRPNVQPRCLISKFLYSVNLERTISISGRLPDYVDGYGWHFRPGYSGKITEVFESSYSRRVVQPPLQAALTGSGLDGKEFSLLSSIFFAKKNRV